MFSGQVVSVLALYSDDLSSNPADRLLFFSKIVFEKNENKQKGAVVVEQLVERSLPIPVVRSSNPVISKIYIEHLLSTVLKRLKLRKKRPRMSHFFKKEVGVGPIKKLTLNDDPKLVAEDWRDAVGRDAHDLAGIDLPRRTKNQSSAVEVRACDRFNHNFTIVIYVLHL